MKTTNIQTYEPYLADWGEADMRETQNGCYVEYFEYVELYKKYIRARAELSKHKNKKNK